MNIRIAIFTLAATAMLTACNGKPQFVGQWATTAPLTITDEIPAAARATVQYTFDFGESPDTRHSGPVLLSAVYDMMQPVSGDTTFVEPYQVSVTATATVNGTWTSADGHDDDELILAFDISTLDINVDPNGVSFSQNLLTGAQQPTVDSLTAATVTRWKAELQHSVTASLGQFSMIDDIDVSDDHNVMTFEIKPPQGKKVDLALRRVFTGK